jgi:hypothetical protein
MAPVNTSIQAVQTQAVKLRQQVKAGQALPALLARFQVVGLLRADQHDLSALPLRTFLDLLAKEAQYAHWKAMQAALLASQPPVFDEATALYQARVHESSLNLWFATYAEAKAELDKRSGCYLLCYRKSFFLAGAAHIRDLGLDPQDPAWQKMGFDWVCPQDQAAKHRLLQQLKAVQTHSCDL